MYARLLKEYGVSILFEKENIDTAYMSSELLLALSGAQAQEESLSISKNMRVERGGADEIRYLPLQLHPLRL